MRLPTALALIAGFPVVAFAGVPIEVPFTCPVGGEKFTITDTAACTTMGATMSLRSVTSCDFVTRLSVCPSNGLPVYREFSADEVKMLTGFLSSDEFAALLPLSSFQRAYGVAEFLGETHSEQGYSLQLSSMWFEPDAFFADANAIEKFLTEVESQRSRVSDEDRPYFLANVAYALAKAGREAEARDWLSHASAASDGSDFLNAYLKAVDGCLGRMNTAQCQPEAPFEF